MCIGFTNEKRSEGKVSTYSIPKGCLKICWLALLVLMTTACEREVSQTDTVLRSGVRYLIGEEEPFTGVVIGKGREGYRRAVCTFKKAYENGLQHGLAVYWYENGKLESQSNYIEGKLHGYATRYWPNGKPKERIHFEHGMRGGGNGEMYWDQKGRKTRG